MKTQPWLIAAALLVGACRTPVDPELVEIDGVIGSSVVNPSAEVRVALVWKVYANDGLRLVAHEVVADGLTFRAGSSGPFTFGISRPPPEEALRPVYNDHLKEIPGVRGAEGALVVYEDLNGNGVVDLVPAGSTTASPDRVLGVPEAIEVGYYEGMIPAEVSASDVRGPGFHLIQYYAGPDNISSARRLPISTPIEIDLTGDPALGEELCEQVWAQGPGPAWSCPGGAG